MSIRIERIKPRCAKGEYPEHTTRGYQLADPRLGREWHWVKNATFVESLEEAADLIENHGFAIRMTCPGKRASLVQRSGLRILRD
jgi:hypothetical protein